MNEYGDKDESVTEFELRALLKIRRVEPCRSERVAQLLWPSSTARQGGLNRSVGRVLGRLRRAGLLERLEHERRLIYRLTDAGHQAVHRWLYSKQVER